MRLVSFQVAGSTAIEVGISVGDEGVVSLHRALPAGTLAAHEGMPEVIGRWAQLQPQAPVQVPEGSLCGFLGPNGAGKSTTIRMIMSIIYPDVGRISVMGGSALDRKDDIGYLPEERGLYRKMRVVELLRYVARLKGIDGSVLRARVDDWLDRMELPDVRRKRCQELSKGMQQKIQFLAAVLHQPELLILDEPFSGLDPVNAMMLNDLIKELAAEGRTILFSTHVLHQAEQMCDRIVLIDRGAKLLDDSLDSIRRRFDPRIVEATPVEDAGGWATAVAAAPEIAAATPTKDGKVRVEVAEGSSPSVTMRACLERGPVSSIEILQPTLDEVFFSIVGGREAVVDA